jgi:hypothetical protein
LELGDRVKGLCLDEQRLRLLVFASLERDLAGGERLLDAAIGSRSGTDAT